MSLHMESEIYSVLQASNDAIKMRNVKELPRGNAVLEIVIDGQSHRQPIRVLSSSPRPNWVAIEDR